ncbi:UDP-N-acetylmuramate dehydrogenase [Gleimia hominis]|uniref:UDP-N-acetylmuramate dehydrogenase n=1 Tax=Gleimia hominis TaxID=595468 RepID=UPI000C7F96DB|nr:UDP-N-acetylmuramate dehydrogenase [Gleimia hominis]WIK64560.1 UDP-N-acetylmuramate dehydrogenase [Gleimia hominis]
MEASFDSCTDHVPASNHPVSARPSHRQYHPDSHRLADWTTLGVGADAETVVCARSEEEIIETVTEADREGKPLLMLGGGSNIVPSDQPFEGVVVRDMREELEVLHNSGCGGVEVRVSAGHAWDTLVARAVQEDWMGFEALSGIPGTVGAAPVQNIGAYGQEVASLVSSLWVYDRLTRSRRQLFVADLQMGYRTSVLKRSLHDARISQGKKWRNTGRWVVLSVDFHTPHASLSAPIGYAQLANALGCELGQRVDNRQVRAAVLALRESKSMVLDDANQNTYSAGSFFTNPIVDAERASQIDPQAPRFPVGDGQVKLSAAWLIAHSGFDKGYRLNPQAPASLSTDHVLAITNRGNARAQDIRALASAVQQGVRAQWGIELVPEPVYLQ